MAKVLIYRTVDEREKGAAGEVGFDRCRKGIDKSVYDTILARHNSIANWPSDEQAKNDITLDDIVAGSTEKLKTARRGEEDYALFTFVREFNVKGASLYYRAEAFLVDARTGTVLWKNAFGDEKWVGLMTAVFTGFIDPGIACPAYGRMLAHTYSTIPELHSQ
jgi:hypothetical protein